MRINDLNLITCKVSWGGSSSSVNFPVSLNTLSGSNRGTHLGVDEVLGMKEVILFPWKYCLLFSL